MEITKPNQLGISFRAIEYRKRFGLCVSGYLHVPFDQQESGVIWGEQSLWNYLSTAMTIPLIDEGVVKTTPEFLVHGQVFPPLHQPSACAVRARLGGTEKTLLAFGERYWDRNNPSDAKPLDKLALSWSHAYGGVDYAANLVGKGRSIQEGMKWLPNLELPHDRLIRPDQAVQPAGFGALDVMHPQRVATRGTYDENYLKEHSPGFAPDLDWSHFNIAPSDQWLKAPIKGDEPYALDHMHPTQRHIQGFLPGLRVRIFAEYGAIYTGNAVQDQASGAKVREVPMRLTTVWFFPHAERMVLVFHGMAETAEDDGSDIAGLLGGVERLSEVKADAHYLDVLRRRRDAQDGSVESMNDHDLLPASINIDDPAFEQAKSAFNMDGLQAEAKFRGAQAEVLGVRQLLSSQGQDPDALGLKMPTREVQPTTAELPAYLKAKRKEMEEQQWDQIDDMVTHVERMQAMVKSGELKPEQLNDARHRGPPDYRAQLHLQELKTLAEHSGQSLDTKDLEPKLMQIEALERINYVQVAHTQPPARKLVGEAASRHKEDTHWMLDKGIRNFAGADLTGADLADLDLRGIDFTGAWLESANLARSNVSGANFTAAVLAHSNLQGLIAIKANFTAANLGRSEMAGAIFDESEFGAAMMMQCDFAKTQFIKAKVVGAQWLESAWGKADWTGVQAADSLFHKFDLKGMVFTEANLAASTFIECDLTGVDLRAANLTGASFITCKLDGALMVGAQLSGAVFSLKCSLVGADMTQANLTSANLGESDLRGARLVKAVLDGACMPLARLDGCDMRLASIQGALMRRTILRKANLAGANFKDAIMQHADLRSTDLRSANLFGADLSRVKLDGDVRLDNALLKRARIWPRLTPEQQAVV
jgi:uncharacterized protein YjbI with pentapeptide repeats